jgi:hypothetical protein
MKRVVYLFIVASFAASVAAVSLSAAEEGVTPIAFQAGIGFDMGVGRTGANLNTGWNISVGAGYNFNSRVGALLDVNTTVFGVNSTTTNRIGVPGGQMVAFSVTADPIVHLIHGSHLDFYVTGGGGMYRRAFFQAGESFEGLSPYSVIKPGVDGGVGVAFGSRWRGKIYGEVRYNHIYDSVNYYYNNYMPVTFGYRW